MSMNPVSNAARMVNGGEDRRFFGHPRGLATLFMTEMWERFSFYGMRALLILFMTAAVEQGGLGFSVAKSGIIYGLYTAMVYLVSLPGGWIADRILGARRSVFYGGILIALGEFALAAPGLTAFYSGLVLIVIGTGLLKPNISTMVGQLYSPEDQRRDAGFSIFYMGINLGAFLSPLICGYLGQRVNWHLGFGVAGVGMALGLIQYVMGGKHLGEAGLRPARIESAEAAAKQKRQVGLTIAAILVAIGILAVLVSLRILQVSARGLSDFVGVILVALVAAVFGWLLFGGEWTPVERKRFLATFVLFVASALFWSAFEQAGSTLSLFAERSTDKHIFGFSYPASWFQSLNSLFIIAFAPVFAWLWVKLGKREPSSPAKFTWGLVLVGAGFAVMAVAANRAASGIQVSGMWLTVTYLLHTFGELCLSPVGLSAITKLAPARVGSMMMGVWFLSVSVGEFIGGEFASLYETFSPAQLFWTVAGFTIGVGLLLVVLVKPMTRLMGGVK
ncbi:MAG TPA: peptide MFS transporter [Bryobacteraceae bacterium]|nr:peptide MFS transporter [Bryobacteraceae bacterium]